MKKAVLITILASLPAALFVIVALVNEILHFDDPCFQWGLTSGQRISPTHECPTVSGASETRDQALTRITLIQGGVLLGLALGMYGTLRRKPYFTLLASFVMFLEAIPLLVGSFPLVILVSCGLFLWVSKLQGIDGVLPRVGAKGLTFASTVVALTIIVVWLISGSPMQGLSFLLTIISMFAFIAALAWYKYPKTD
jgi:hypothetical protein